MAGPLIRVRNTHSVRIEREGSDVVFLLDGKLIFRAHWRFADQIGQSLLLNARDAAKAEQVLTAKG